MNLLIIKYMQDIYKWTGCTFTTSLLLNLLEMLYVCMNCNYHIHFNTAILINSPFLLYCKPIGSAVQQRCMSDLYPVRKPCKLNHRTGLIMYIVIKRWIKLIICYSKYCFIAISCVQTNVDCDTFVSLLIY